MNYENYWLFDKLLLFLLVSKLLHCMRNCKYRI